MYRFLSWMAIGIAAAFLVVGTAAFSLPVIKWLAFATLIVSGSIGFSYRQHIPALAGLAITGITEHEREGCRYGIPLPAGLRNAAIE